jgi:lauroyl/myristoyl acyltransferase
MQHSREARGLRVLPRRGAMQHAPTIIKAGGTLAMLLDQRARTRPVFAPFFGRLARCDRSAGVLLRRLRAPAVIGACYMEGPWRWRVHFHDVLHPRDLAGKSPEEIATTINTVLERLIRAAPEQYFWLHDRYREAEPEDLAAGANEAGDEPIG